MEVFFSRPGNDCEIFDRISNDIKYAQERILCAMYSFNDAETIELINNSSTTEKYMVIDKNQYINENKGKIQVSNTVHVELLGYDGSHNGLFSNMHHKFFVIDNVLWVGSFNISHTAKTRNWENCMRISDSDIVKKYVEEFWNIYLFSHINRYWIKLNRNKCIAYEDDKEFQDASSDFRFNVDVSYIFDENGKWDNGCIKNYSLDSVEDDFNIIKCQSCNCIEYAGRINRINYKYKYFSGYVPSGYVTSSEINICRKCLINTLKGYWKRWIIE